MVAMETVAKEKLTILQDVYLILVQNPRRKLLQRA